MPKEKCEYGSSMETTWTLSACDLSESTYKGMPALPSLSTVHTHCHCCLQQNLPNPNTLGVYYPLQQRKSVFMRDAAGWCKCIYLSHNWDLFHGKWVFDVRQNQTNSTHTQKEESQGSTERSRLSSSRQTWPSGWGVPGFHQFSAAHYRCTTLQ